MPTTWFVTGCSSGLGRAVAERALARGCRVVATARNPATLRGLVESAPGRCLALPLDITDQNAVRSAVLAAQEAFGGIDVLCSNAGFGLIGGIEEFSDEQITRCLATNLLGPINLLRAALPHMRSRRQGHILLVSAIAALANHEGFSIYGAAKAGLEALAEALALETKPLGIHTTLVLPGPTRTDFIARSLEAAANPIADYAPTAGKFATFLRQISGKQTGDPAKIADLMIDLTQMERPPLRVVTGKYALNRARAKLKAMNAELDALEAQTIATDF